MRMSGVLFGGLLGAAAATYFIRNGKMSGMMSGMSTAGMGSSIGKAMNGMMAGKQGNGMQHNHSGHEGYGKQDARSIGLDKVSELLSKDTFVKAQVNEILKENHETGHVVR